MCLRPASDAPTMPGRSDGGRVCWGTRRGLFVMLRDPFVGTGSLGRAGPPRKEAGRKARLCRGAGGRRSVV